MDYVLARIKEPSTWRGLIAVLGLVGVNIAPEIQAQIISTGVALYGIIQIFRKEK